MLFLLGETQTSGQSYSLFSPMLCGPFWHLIYYICSIDFKVFVDSSIKKKKSICRFIIYIHKLLKKCQNYVELTQNKMIVRFSRLRFDISRILNFKCKQQVISYHLKSLIFQGCISFLIHHACFGILDGIFYESSQSFHKHGKIIKEQFSMPALQAQRRVNQFTIDFLKTFREDLHLDKKSVWFMATIFNPKVMRGEWVNP